MKYNGSDIWTKPDSEQLASVVATTWSGQQKPAFCLCQAALSGFVVEIAFTFRVETNHFTPEKSPWTSMIRAYHVPFAYH